MLLLQLLLFSFGGDPQVLIEKRCGLYGPNPELESIPGQSNVWVRGVEKISSLQDSNQESEESIDRDLKPTIEPFVYHVGKQQLRTLMFAYCFCICPG